MTADPLLLPHQRSQSLWDCADAELAGEESVAISVVPGVPIGLRRRRGVSARDADGRASVSLVNDDGVLRWVYEPPLHRQRSSMRSWRSFNVQQQDVVKRFSFSELGSNDVTEALIKVDEKLNPSNGLRRWDGSKWSAVNASDLSGRVLLLIHGTFSRSEMYTSELGSTKEGADLWERLTKDYKAIIAFDHPTLSVAPWLNALQLHRDLREFKGELDVVCHSRGGLVLSWALRVGPLRIRKAVLVGSPLVGTSLAAPSRLRDALDMLANVATAIEYVSRGAGYAFPPALPLAIGAAGLARALGRTLHLGAGLPIADAAVSLVPGLAGQSLSSSNLELKALFSDRWVIRPELSAISVSFEPNEVEQPVWKFWRRFTHIGDQAKFAMAGLIFPGDNDLVVDCASMFQLGEREKITDICEIGASPVTHHCSYFRDPKALAFLDLKLV